MNSEKVFIYINSGRWRTGRVAPTSLAHALPYITNENEYSFDGAGMFSHGHCMEAQIGRRPHETYIEVRELLTSRSRIPFVRIIDLSHLRDDIVSDIAGTRRWMPLAVFVLYCSDYEYERCVAEVPDEWKIRLSRFFRFPKSEDAVSRSQLRKLLDAATGTAIEKVKHACIFSAFISYSHTDQTFARWLHETLVGHGIKCWLDEKQLRAGDKIHSKVESAIQERDKVLLCASKASLTSWWVDNELNSVIAKEQALWRQTREEALVLVPLNLDGFIFSDAWKSGWKNQVISRIAPDFTHWNSDRPCECDDALSSVIRALIIDKTTNGNPFTDV